MHFTWKNVGVLDYDENNNYWLVQESNAEDRIIDEQSNPLLNKGVRPDGTRKLSSNQYWIPRIQLQFLAEDPRWFADRVEAAYKERNETESFLRYQFYIDSMPFDDVSDLDPVSFKRMLDWAKSSSGLRLL